MPVVKNNKIQLTLQPRKTEREYVYDYHAQLSKVNGKTDYFGHGGGASVKKSAAKRKAIAEALERYCGSTINQKLISAPFNKISGKILNPQKIIYFKDSQYSKNFLYRRFDPAMAIDWVEGFSLTQGKKILLPAFAVYLGYNRKISPKNRLMPTSSCGLAIHRSLTKATIKSIFELIERDAAMIVWLTKRRAPRLNLKYAKLAKLTFLRDKILKEGLQPEIIISTIDFPIPSTIGIIYDKKKEMPYVSFGLGTETSLEEAAAKSLEEALMIFNTLEILKDQKQIRKNNRKDVQNFIDHAIFYAFSEREKFWKFLLEGPQMTTDQLIRKYQFTKSKKYGKLSNLLQFFRKRKQEVIRIDLTNKLIRQQGFVVTKAIIPDLQPMDLSFNARFLGGPRLLNFKIKNNEPHPYA